MGALDSDEHYLDPTRITLLCGAAGYDGTQFKPFLASEHDIQINKTSRNSVLDQINMNNTRSDLAHLIKALADMARGIEKRLAEGGRGGAGGLQGAGEVTGRGRAGYPKIGQYLRKAAQGYVEEWRALQKAGRQTMTSFGGAMLGAALALGTVAWSAPAVAKAGRLVGEATPASTRRATIVYTAPTSTTWGPSVGAPPTFAFGKPAEVLLVVPGGYVVRQELPLELAIEHATYVSRQVGQPIAVTTPDPAGGPPRVEYVGACRGDIGK